MNKLSLALVLALATGCVAAAEPVVFSAEQLKAKVEQVTQAQNKVMLKGSVKADVDRLFALYSDDFVYIHEAYGGSYSKEQLYANTLRLMSMGKYDQTEARYRIINLMPGYNAVAVQRQEIYNGVTQNHLAVFEFCAGKVTKIIEYWK
jgi:hypothetical protein